MTFISIWIIALIFGNFLRKGGEFWKLLENFLNVRDERIIKRLAQPKPHDYEKPTV